MIAILVATLLIGLLVFNLLTRRLTRLTRNVQKFTQSGFDPVASFHVDDGKDEISQLGQAFRRMADKIGEQFVDLRETDRLRLDQLIGDLFELSKLDANCVHPSLETFSLAELMQDITQEFELKAQKAGIELSFEAPEQQAMVHADIGLVQRVLENLLQNALKHTPAGGKVSIQLDPSPGAIRVAVADTGHGIPAEDLEHIFERFYRAGKPDSGEAYSTGLGLAIVKRILDLHGSRITVNSQPNRGTRFEFDLPAAA